MPEGPHSERFEAEARAIAALNHPHICQLYDIGLDYLVLEYIDGPTWRRSKPKENPSMPARTFSALGPCWKLDLPLDCAI